jgi:hypothetical protein
MSVTCICYIQIFPPPLIHGLVGSSMTIVHFLYRTHAFNVLASVEQKLMPHSAAECTICAIKGATLVSVMIYFRVQPLFDIEDQPFDNRTREEQNVQGKAIEDLDQTEFGGINKIIFGAAPSREGAENDSESEQHDIEMVRNPEI